jgi:hypothetical protein
MTQVTERTRRDVGRPMPDAAPLDDVRGGSRPGTALRVLGALAVLAVGAVHLEQYFGVHFNVVPIIGPLFVLNFAGAALIALGLLLPLGRLHIPLALGGMGLAATSFVFFFISERQPLFGFQDYGYRPAIIIALVAEAAAVVLLGGYLVRRIGTA